MSGDNAAHGKIKIMSEAAIRGGGLCQFRQFDVLELVSSISHKGSVITMGNHKSVEARRLTELGEGLDEWSQVLTGIYPPSVDDCSPKAAMREIALMDDTYENRELLCEAAYRCGLPEREADALAQWAKSPDVLKYGRSSMRCELTEYVRGTWPDVEDLADAIMDTDGVDSSTVIDSSRMIIERGDVLLHVALDWDAAESIAISCPDLDNPPIGIAMAVNAGDVEHMVCATVDQAVNAVVDRIHRLDMEGK